MKSLTGAEQLFKGVFLGGRGAHHHTLKGMEDKLKEKDVRKKKKGKGKIRERSKEKRRKSETNVVQQGKRNDLT